MKNFKKEVKTFSKDYLLNLKIVTRDDESALWKKELLL